MLNTHDILRVTLLGLFIGSLFFATLFVRVDFQPIAPTAEAQGPVVENVFYQSNKNYEIERVTLEDGTQCYVLIEYVAPRSISCVQVAR